MNDLQTRILIYSKDGVNLKPIKIYKDDEGRNWVEAKDNTKFVIEIKNNTYEKLLSVVSVDGLSVITGDKAELEPNDGYVLNPYSSTKIKGWRTSLTEVREFVFTNNKKESYSHKLGANENNIGVIGVAFFKQKTLYNTIISSTMYPQYTWTSMSSGTYLNREIEVNCLTSVAEDKSFSMATKQGEAIKDTVQEVSCEFQETPYIIDTIYYDSRENLIEKGIIKEEEEMPRPFGSSKFCPSL